MPRNYVTCAICRSTISSDVEDAFCRGCRTYICLGCDQRTVPGTHVLADHTRVPDDTDDDGPDFDFVLQ